MQSTADISPTEEQQKKIDSVLQSFNFTREELKEATAMVLAYLQSHTLMEKGKLLGCLPQNLTAFVARAKQPPITPEDERRIHEQVARIGEDAVEQGRRWQLNEARIRRETLGE